MNLADSGILSAVMEQSGYRPTAIPEEAEIIIINTCSVREKAEERALGRLRELVGIRKDHRTKICAVGCMAQRMGRDLVQKVPGIDFILGTEKLFELPGLIGRVNDGPLVDIQQGVPQELLEYPPQPDNPYSAHITITRGCNNYCAYCIVPYLRGPEKHRDPDKIINDVRHVLGKGIIEVTLVGQNVNSYEWEDLRFPGLLKRVIDETGLKRLRFITSHPKDLSDELIDLFGNEPALMGHLHLPLQSGSDRILDLMRRRYTYDQYREKVKRIREARPDIALTTDLIVGFPGESEAEYQMTLAAVEEITFDAAFMFRYSVREGTWAAKNLADDIPETVKIDRLQKLIDLQKNISFNVNQREVGRVRQVLIDGTSRRDAKIWKGRSEGNKTILTESAENLIGRVVPVRITASDSWTLHGEHII